MSAYQKDGQDFLNFSEQVVDRVIEILEIIPLESYQKPDGSVTTVKEEIWNRLNFIKRSFGNPEYFNNRIPPAEMRKILTRQHRKISEALEVLLSLKDVGNNTDQSKENNAIRMWLYDVSEVNPMLSGGLIGYDVANFDQNFTTAISSLKKIEAYFSSVKARAESSVKGRGENKIESGYSDYLLLLLCRLYRDVTGELPRVSLHKDTGTARGRVILFLEYILQEFPYPGEVTHWALEQKIRRLKNHEVHGQLWKDNKR